MRRARWCGARVRAVRHRCRAARPFGIGGGRCIAELDGGAVEQARLGEAPRNSSSFCGRVALVGFPRAQVFDEGLLRGVEAGDVEVAERGAQAGAQLEGKLDRAGGGVGERIDGIGVRIGIAGLAQAGDERIAGFDDGLRAGRDACIERGEQRLKFGARRLVGRDVEIVDAGGRVDEERAGRDVDGAGEGVDAFSDGLDVGLVVAFGFEEGRDEGCACVRPGGALRTASWARALRA
jgi:hypothetical protein